MTPRHRPLLIVIAEATPPRTGDWLVSKASAPLETISLFDCLLGQQRFVAIIFQLEQARLTFIGLMKDGAFCTRVVVLNI